MALGADRLAILRAYLVSGLAIASIGVAMGWIGSWLMRPLVSHLLSDSGVAASAGTVVMNGTETAVLSSAAILAAALAASWLPARRAASIEPMEALRTE